MDDNRSRIVIERGPFYCTHLQCPDLKDIQDFTCRDDRGRGLVNYLQHRAWYDECYDAMRTYLVRDTESHELVGYFSLKAGLVSGEEYVVEDETAFDTLPGVELANFAVNYEYIKAHPNVKGIGLLIFNDFVLQITKRAADNIGLQLLYIFALPEDKLIERYYEYGFLRLNKKSEENLHHRLKPKYDKGCIFMFQQFDPNAIEDI